MIQRAIKKGAHKQGDNHHPRSRELGVGRRSTQTVENRSNAHREHEQARGAQAKRSLNQEIMGLLSVHLGVKKAVPVEAVAQPRSLEKEGDAGAPDVDPLGGELIYVTSCLDGSSETPPTEVIVRGPKEGARDEAGAKGGQVGECDVLPSQPGRW
jgi:hypothetical protein